MEDDFKIGTNDLLLEGNAASPKHPDPPTSVASRLTQAPPPRRKRKCRFRFRQIRRRVTIRHYASDGTLLREVRLPVHSRHLPQALEFPDLGASSGEALIHEPKPSQRPDPVCTHDEDYLCQACSPVGRRKHLQLVRDGEVQGSKPHAKVILISKVDMTHYLATKRATPNHKREGKLDGKAFLKKRGL